MRQRKRETQEDVEAIFNELGQQAASVTSGGGNFIRREDLVDGIYAVVRLDGEQFEWTNPKDANHVYLKLPFSLGMTFNAAAPKKPLTTFRANLDDNADDCSKWPTISLSRKGPKTMGRSGEEVIDAGLEKGHTHAVFSDFRTYEKKVGNDVKKIGILGCQTFPGDSAVAKGFELIASGAV